MQPNPDISYSVRARDGGSSAEDPGGGGDCAGTLGTRYTSHTAPPRGR